MKQKETFLILLQQDKMAPSIFRTLPFHYFYRTPCKSRYIHPFPMSHPTNSSLSNTYHHQSHHNQQPTHHDPIEYRTSQSTHHSNKTETQTDQPQLQSTQDPQQQLLPNQQQYQLS